MNPVIVGILNVTPDSFSDGGQHFDAPIAVEHGLRMSLNGADIVDVGGESTRPGAAEVSAEEEWQRIEPVIRGLVAQGVKVSVDTYKPEVAARALQAGAFAVNEVRGLTDPGMLEVCAEAKCDVWIMHSRGTSATMQTLTQYGDVVSEVRDYLVERAQAAEIAGIPKEKIWIDPGFGFAKTLDQNLELIARLDEIVATGYPVLVGVSRKSFTGAIGSLNGQSLPHVERGPATLACEMLCWQKGAYAIRTHDPFACRSALKMVQSIQQANKAVQ